MSQAYPIRGVHDGHEFEWELRLVASSQKQGPIVTCTHCGGGCRPHFGMIDDPEPCFFCNNTGKQVDPNYRWVPEPPKELVDALRKVWREHWNKIENDNFKLT